MHRECEQRQDACGRAAKSAEKLPSPAHLNALFEYRVEQKKVRMCPPSWRPTVFFVLHLRLLMIVLIIVKGELARGLCAQDASDHASCGNKVLLQPVEATMQLRCGPETPNSHDCKLHGRGPTAQAGWEIQ